MVGVLLVLVYFGLAALAAFVILQPDRFVVTREAALDAPPAQVFPLVNELRNWENWSPWAKLDPNMAKTYSGPAGGAGASYEWSGDKKVGAGRMTITDSRSPGAIDMKLEFLRPFKATHDVSFRLAAENGGTRVVWTMAGRNNLLAKAMRLVTNMDKMIGGDFERGLANLEALCREKKP